MTYDINTDMIKKIKRVKQKFIKLYYIFKLKIFTNLTELEKQQILIKIINL